MIVVCLLENAGIDVDVWYLCVMLLWLARMMHGGFCKKKVEMRLLNEIFACVCGFFA